MESHSNGPQISSVTFGTHFLVGNENHAVGILGSIPELGNWHPESTVLLVPQDGGTWRNKLTLPSLLEFEWKLVLFDKSSCSIIRWEESKNRIWHGEEAGHISIDCVWSCPELSQVKRKEENVEEYISDPDNKFSEYSIKGGQEFALDGIESEEIRNLHNENDNEVLDKDSKESEKNCSFSDNDLGKRVCMDSKKSKQEFAVERIENDGLFGVSNAAGEGRFGVDGKENFGLEVNNLDELLASDNTISKGGFISQRIETEEQWELFNLSNKRAEEVLKKFDSESTDDEFELESVGSDETIVLQNIEGDESIDLKGNGDDEGKSWFGNNGQKRKIEYDCNNIDRESDLESTGSEETVVLESEEDDERNDKDEIESNDKWGLCDNKSDEVLGEESEKKCYLGDKDLDESKGEIDLDKQECNDSSSLCIEKEEEIVNLDDEGSDEKFGWDDRELDEKKSSDCHRIEEIFSLESIECDEKIVCNVAKAEDKFDLDFNGTVALDGNGLKDSFAWGNKETFEEFSLEIAESEESLYLDTREGTKINHSEILKQDSIIEIDCIESDPKCKYNVAESNTSKEVPGITCDQSETFISSNTETTVKSRVKHVTFAADVKDPDTSDEEMSDVEDTEYVCAGTSGLKIQRLLHDTGDIDVAEYEYDSDDSDEIKNVQLLDTIEKISPRSDVPCFAHADQFSGFDLDIAAKRDAEHIIFDSDIHGQVSSDNTQTSLQRKDITEEDNDRENGVTKTCHKLTKDEPTKANVKHVSFHFDVQRINSFDDKTDGIDVTNIKYNDEEKMDISIPCTSSDDSNRTHVSTDTDHGDADANEIGKVKATEDKHGDEFDKQSSKPDIEGFGNSYTKTSCSSDVPNKRPMIDDEIAAENSHRQTDKEVDTSQKVPLCSISSRNPATENIDDGCGTSDLCATDRQKESHLTGLHERHDRPTSNEYVTSISNDQNVTNVQSENVHIDVQGMVSAFDKFANGMVNAFDKVANLKAEWLKQDKKALSTSEPTDNCNDSTKHEFTKCMVSTFDRIANLRAQGLKHEKEMSATIESTDSGHDSAKQESTDGMINTFDRIVKLRTKELKQDKEISSPIEPTDNDHDSIKQGFTKGMVNTIDTIVNLRTIGLKHDKEISSAIEPTHNFHDSNKQEFTKGMVNTCDRFADLRAHGLKHDKEISSALEPTDTCHDSTKQVFHTDEVNTFDTIVNVSPNGMEISSAIEPADDGHDSIKRKDHKSKNNILPPNYKYIWFRGESDVKFLITDEDEQDVDKCIDELARQYDQEPKGSKHQLESISLQKLLQEQPFHRPQRSNKRLRKKKYRRASNKKVTGCFSLEDKNISLAKHHLDSLSLQELVLEQPLSMVSGPNKSLGNKTDCNFEENKTTHMSINKVDSISHLELLKEQSLNLQADSTTTLGAKQHNIETTKDKEECLEQGDKNTNSKMCFDDTTGLTKENASKTGNKFENEESRNRNRKVEARTGFKNHAVHLEGFQNVKGEKHLLSNKEVQPQTREGHVRQIRDMFELGMEKQIQPSKTKDIPKQKKGTCMLKFEAYEAKHKHNRRVMPGYMDFESDDEECGLETDHIDETSVLEPVQSGESQEESPTFHEEIESDPCFDGVEHDDQTDFNDNRFAQLHEFIQNCLNSRTAANVAIIAFGLTLTTVFVLVKFRK